LSPQKIYCKPAASPIMRAIAMTYLLPPLNALRAFEAAARHLSFKLAAHELHVTPGAVAQQVKGLEAQLGVALFERLYRQLALTSVGQAYLPPLREAFGRIAAATERLTPQHAQATIRLGVHGGYDAASLMRRIERFRANQGAGVHVRISRPAGFRELVEGKVNVVIDRSLGHHPGYSCHPLGHALVPGRPTRPGDFLICPSGTVDCPEIIALRGCLLAPDNPEAASRAQAFRG
jgi:LysR family transcriptional regulator, glycine cleavage system transcriptional activator